MSYTFLSFIKVGSWRAVFLRELRAALINRYVQVFVSLSLLSGFAAVFLSENAHATAFFIVQVVLFLVSLFALLAGASSAQAEREEWQLMLCQPVLRAAYVIGKFVAYLSIFAAVLALLLVPSMFGGAQMLQLALRYVNTLLLAAAFLALGLAAGFLARDATQALVIGLGVWLFLLFGVDLVALFVARFEFVQKYPDVWVSLLMLNPLDAFRIQELFALEQIPAEAANKTPLASWWITHASLWVSVIAATWSIVLVAVASIRLSRFEQ
jgi:Cu-processing system permease protein